MGLLESLFNIIRGDKYNINSLPEGTERIEGIGNKKEKFLEGVKYNADDKKNNNAASTYIAYTPKYLEKNDLKYSIDLFRISDDGRVYFGTDKNHENSKTDKYLLILRYNTLEKYEQVVLGTVDYKENMVTHLKEIVTNLREQLEGNLKGKEYKNNLQSYLRKHEIIMDFTEEGKEILSQKDDNIKIYQRTKLIEEENGQFYIKDSNIKEQLSNQREEDRIRLQRYMILRDMSPDEKEKFLRGEEVAIRKRLFNDATTYDDIMKLGIDESEIVNELKENSKKELGDQRTTGKSLYEKYLRLKERGLAIDAKKILEEKRVMLLDSDDGEGYKRLGTLGDYFDALKYGYDHMARKIKQKVDINISEMGDILRDDLLLDEELLRYIELRERYDEALDINSGATIQEMSENPDINAFVTFLEKVPLRNQTEESKEELGKIYAQVIEGKTDMDIIYNIDALEFYNKSVENLSPEIAYPYPTSEELVKIIRKMQFEQLLKYKKEYNNLSRDVQEDIGEK